MNVLGVSSRFHDATAALVKDRALIATAAEERFSGLKHDPNHPRFAIDFCLEQGGLHPGDLDRVVYYEEPHEKFVRILASAFSTYPAGISTFSRSMRRWLGGRLWAERELARAISVPPGKIDVIPHHLSHAAQAFVGSPFSSAAVLIADAVGEWECTTLARASRDPALSIEPLETIEYPNSLGLFFSAVTAFLGFRPNSDESSTMALAAFGRPRFREEMGRVLRIDADGTYTLDTDFFAFESLLDRPYSRRFQDLFGRPRDGRLPLPLDAIEGGRAEIPPDIQRYADIAASAQAALEDALLALANRLSALTGETQLCYAGGVALNCVANSMLAREGPFADIFVPPDPGDGGAAVGAALLYGAGDAGRSEAMAFHPYLGKAYDSGSIVDLLEGSLVGEMPEGCSRRIAGYRVVADEEELVATVAEAICKGAIVGWMQGRFEVGPRALGNRSILADPSDPAVARRLRAAVKHRAPFRPLALSLAEEAAPRLLELGERDRFIRRWMQSTAPVLEDFRSALRGGLHADGSTRPQVCGPRDNALFHRLLTAVGDINGVPAVINTSFNERGLPMVSSPLEALLSFVRSDADMLVVGDLVVRREPALS